MFENDMAFNPISGTKDIVEAIVVIKINIKNQNHILVGYIIIKKDKKKQGII